ncbi:hypothetical protein [Holospora curviuscula]|uniref:Uncharacterized protein n=1 Tax=Holospora curviuscula TaxID=1082868 RepID=A0A2S5R8E2_9PROT|nr:hypothetical protein [Holospora curviuscula]PPE03596.1 hypothetical protein HCUR_00951 [Holospora curviuscula]
MDCLEHDITIYPDAHQPERFGGSAVGVLKALRRLDVRDKKTLNHPKVDPEKRSVLYQKHDELNRKVNERGIVHDMSKTHGDSVKG